MGRRMTPERWKRIDELYHAATPLAAKERAAYLATACPDDSAVRAEVEALLNEPAPEPEFLGSAALSNAAAQLVSDLAPDANVGRTLGPYLLERLLGIGGMGVVYFARDRKLQRDVAIKILPQAFTGNIDRLARFEREARTLASLHHPNICGIYGLEETAGVRFLVLEFVDGNTLADVIQRTGRGLELREALRIGRQIVDALEAAHDKGIVHRDLKPANIKLTPDRIIKVLDFGLAKMTDDRAPVDGHTRDGLILGTAAYMSPEQARGKAVDKRSDIWAFGCIVFEMLTGRVAFAGETDSDIIGKILEREPDWSALPATTPATVRRLLLRCLAKDPKQRLRDIGDAGIEIDSFGEEISAGSSQPIPSPARVRGHATWLPWAAMAMLIVAGGAWAMSRPSIVEDPPLAHAQFSRFTDWEGTEAGAEISPDGNWVAFVADRDGELALWVRQVGSGDFVKLTKNLPPLSAATILRTFGFTADGSEVWFTLTGDAGAPKSLIPLTGGTPRPFLDQGSTAPSWSPDGKRLVYFTNGDGDPLWLADRTSADAMRIAVDTPGFFASGVHTHNPVWAPDGQWLYFAHGIEPTEEMNVWRVRPSGGTPEQLTALHAAANHVAVVDAHTVLYVARAEDGSGPWLWSLDVDSKVSRRVTSGLDHYSSVSASRDGRRIVATVRNPTASLWQVPLSDRPPTDRDVQPYALPSMHAFAPRVAGPSLFYLSGDGVGDGLWRFEDGTASEIWRAGPAAIPEPPATSRDGTRVAVVARQQGKLRLSVMSRDGTGMRTLAPSITILSSGGKGNADWSPDGAWIVAAGSDGQGPGIFKIPVDGGRPVRLASGQVVNPVWSPDGSLIVYGGAVVGGQVPLLGVRPDGTPVALPKLWVRLGGGQRFLPDGTGLVYLPRGQSSDFWLLSLATQQTRALTSLSNRGGIQTFDITRDGKSIVFDRLRENSDIVLIELPADRVNDRGSVSR
jgi:Tol biopolymer transport system component